MNGIGGFTLFQVPRPDSHRMVESIFLPGHPQIDADTSQRHANNGYPQQALLHSGILSLAAVTGNQEPQRRQFALPGKYLLPTLTLDSGEPMDSTQCTSMNTEPEGPFLPHGGYRKLRSYKVAEAVYDATVIFCRRFLAR